MKMVSSTSRSARGAPSTLKAAHFAPVDCAPSPHIWHSA